MNKKKMLAVFIPLVILTVYSFSRMGGIEGMLWSLPTGMFGGLSFLLGIFLFMEWIDK